MNELGIHLKSYKKNSKLNPRKVKNEEQKLMKKQMYTWGDKKKNYSLKKRNKSDKPLTRFSRDGLQINNYFEWKRETNYRYKYFFKNIINDL